MAEQCAGAQRAEVINSLTHGLAAALSLAGLAGLVVLAALRGTAWHIVSYSIYGLTLVLLFTASTCYHGTRHPRLKQALRVVDHAAIFLLIAGTYTPFTLTVLRGAWGWSVFGCVWGLAVAGIVLKVYFTGRYEAFSVALYLVMGWLVLVALKPLIRELSSGGLGWLLAGGLLYTMGTLFYGLWRVPHHHAIWHLFVLLGAGCHYAAIAFYLW